MHHLPEHLCHVTCVGVRLRAEAFSRLVLACRGLGKFILLGVSDWGGDEVQLLWGFGTVACITVPG